MKMLGNRALSPLDLSKYDQDFPGEDVFDMVDLNIVKESVENSIRKYVHD